MPVLRGLVVMSSKTHTHTKIVGTRETFILRACMCKTPRYTYSETLPVGCGWCKDPDPVLQKPRSDLLMMTSTTVLRSTQQPPFIAKHRWRLFVHTVNVQ